MREDILTRLTDRDDSSACAFTDIIAEESRESDKWYGYFDEFASLLDHPKSLVRNRALHILAENARWDKEGRFDTYIEAFLSHITDEKPITARQCIKFLPRIAAAKRQYIPLIVKRLSEADTSRYKDSMRPLIDRDIREVLSQL